MKDFIIKCRNSISRVFYKFFLKKLFFLRDPEKVHNNALKFGKFLGSKKIGRALTAAFFAYQNRGLEQTICGIHFKNPVGLAAGFDKDGVLVDILPAVGFGFEEVGSVTGEPCKGNPKPRLWRLKKSRSLVVNFGLKSEGCEKVAERMKKRLAERGKIPAPRSGRGQSFAGMTDVGTGMTDGAGMNSGTVDMPIGISVAKTNCAEIVSVEAGINDYVKAFKVLQPYGDYMTINISCPNAFGGQPFTNPEDFDKLMKEILACGIEKPIFIKMPPDLSFEEVDKLLKVVEKYKIAGFICTNLTKNRKNPEMMSKIVEKDLPPSGGISGKPVEELANKLIAYLYKKAGRRYVIIGCGGVFSAEDAYEKIRLGASLIQLITGMIFEGPQLISEINMGLVKLLKRDGFKNIAEAVGKEEVAR